MNESAVLLLHAADRKGLVATIANFCFAWRQYSAR
jgi:formyltetrahydrofolate hydrolase